MITKRKPFINIFFYFYDTINDYKMKWAHAIDLEDLKSCREFIDVLTNNTYISLEQYDNLKNLVDGKYCRYLFIQTRLENVKCERVHRKFSFFVKKEGLKKLAEQAILN